MSKVPKFIPNPAYKARSASSSKFSAQKYVNRVRGPLSTAQLARLHEEQLRGDANRVYGEAGGVEYAARDHDRFVRQQRF